jgi:hypothetical protein
VGHIYFILVAAGTICSGLYMFVLGLHYDIVPASGAGHLYSFKLGPNGFTGLAQRKRILALVTKTRTKRIIIKTNELRPQKRNMRNFEFKRMLRLVRRLCGQLPGGPKEVASQL